MSWGTRIFWMLYTLVAIWALVMVARIVGLP
jgi:hypothetical protein